MKLPKPEQQTSSSPEAIQRRFTRRDYLTPHVFAPAALVACFSLFLLWAMLPEGIYDYAPSFMRSHNPLREPVWFAKKIDHKGYELTPIRHYVLDARLWGKHEYVSGDGDLLPDLSPIDMFFGWGPMADPRVSKYMTVSIRDRGALPRGNNLDQLGIPDLDMSGYEFRLYADNNHLIPATPKIEQRLREAPEGSLIHLEGFFIEARRDGFIKPWKSNLNYGVTGVSLHPYKALITCKVIYVTKFEVKK